jgi:hypothetical protein
MWEVSNRTPYAVEKSWVRDKHGMHVWLVAVKATFDIDPDGRLTLADEQALALLAPEFCGDPARSSLRYEADVVPVKPNTDVLLNGSAFAPNGRPCKQVSVTMRVADLQKTLLVHGPRTYYKTLAGGLDITSAEPFVNRTFSYEDAYGGADLSDPEPRKQRYDARNPVGKGVAADPDRLESTPAHSVEYPKGDPAQRGPAGFGPLASFWSPRRERGGTYDEAWATSQKPLLPTDYSDAHLLCAPDDQRPTQHLHGGEPVYLENLTARGSLTFTLPKLYFSFATHFGSNQQQHRGRIGAVIIEPDAMKLMVVWNSSLLVRGRDVDYLDYTLVEEKPYLT